MGVASKLQDGKNIPGGETDRLYLFESDTYSGSTREAASLRSSGESYAYSDEPKAFWRLISARDPELNCM
jgi:hypothetical protein